MDIMVGLWRHPTCYNSPPPKTVSALPPSAESDRAATHVASPGYDAATDDWGSASDVGKGSNGGPSWWGAGLKKN
jgi:hypothetical protein